jgi:zinc transport system substrate-binding protein
MVKKWSTILLCLIIAVSFSGCSNKNQETKTEESNTQINNTDQSSETGGNLIKVSVTFDAMKEFVNAVGKDKVEVSTIIPSGMEPHDFEPKAQDLAAISAASVFVYSGLGIEAWAEEATRAANNSELIVVEASKGADLIENTDAEIDEHSDEENADEEHADEENGDDEHGHEHGQYDPHIWLSLKGAQTQVENIKDALIQSDPANKDYYEANCKEFISQSENLYNEYNEKFQAVEKKNFVTGHAAFGYLCREFNLEQNSVEDVFAEGEPSPKQLAELVEYCKEHKVTTIFAEEMASPEISKTLADEVGAKVQTIYTIESSEDEMSYLERMTSNLSKIYESLK